MEHKNIFMLDWDGTGLDNFFQSLENIETIAKDIGVPVPDRNSRDFKKIWGSSGHAVAEFCFPGYDPEKINQKRRELENRKKLDLMPGATEAIKYSKERGDVFGILTNRTWRGFRKFEHLWGPLDFDFVQTPEYKFKRWLKYSLNPFGIHLTTRRFKPDPKCFKPVFRWLKRKRIKPKKIYYIGDCLVDFEVVRNANERYGYNIEFIGVLTGPIRTRREWYEMTGARFLTLRSVADLPIWLDDREEEMRFNFKIKLFEEE